MVPPGSLATVVVDPNVGGLLGWADAIARYRPAAASPALGAAQPLPGVPKDLLGVFRSSTTPTMGAIENP